jgi:serine/threonine protein phosphatase PrpC
VRDNEFPQNPKQAILNGFQKSEAYFLETVEKFSNGRSNMLDRSGSCAIVIIFVDDVCYTANLGDSRAILSCCGGTLLANLSIDHKPGS